ncbi:hypothetical protein [Dyella mobilis]|uniref:Uncharacterized protein n=1 Tax=Dyella mobilis TaxID=1849582 RepID=A0ABS2KJY9_9GAMM|nr:hypothetical protein [Dyella mobilis]MBM7131248.1 hypothetical protein [Dyella mobilis]GLQ98815.1 hypothetical protein GCM10007863_32350 [Dyella mobilis]
MNNEDIEIVRPFARMMANEVSKDEMDLMTKKGTFNSMRSGHAINDWPDTP